MHKYRFKKIDAFVSGSSAGNPAAAVYLDSFDDIIEEDMQRIAQELRGFVSEVVNVLQEKEEPKERTEDFIIFPKDKRQKDFLRLLIP